MKIRFMKYYAIVFGIILVFGSNIQSSVAIPEHKKENGLITIETDALVVKITGGSNVPSYSFWSTSDPGTKYKVQFDSLFEAIDQNSDGVYDIGTDKRVPNSGIASLSSLSWTFSEIIESGDNGGSIDFNMTSNNIFGRDDMSIKFNNHINSNADSQLKFDILINGYQFSDNNAMLVLAFKIIEQGGENALQDGDSVNFGTGFFQVEETAQVNGEDIDVRLSTSDDGGVKMFIAYEQFSGDLVHDPTIGVQTNGVDTKSDQNQKVLTENVFPFELSKDVLITTSVIATILVIGVPVIILKVRGLKS